MLPRGDHKTTTDRGWKGFARRGMCIVAIACEIYLIPLYKVHNTRMRIGELAERAEVNIQTLRFYEREGLIPPPERTASGYRSYALSDLERVRFIRICQGLGFTL